jgi:hypothetical protein
VSAPATKGQILLAQVATIALIGLFVAGIAWYGLSAEIRSQTWMDLADRSSGPLGFRFILQPCVAGIAALRDGVQDARLEGKPYLWALLTGSRDRGALLFEGLIATSRVILLGLVMDSIYQWIEFSSFHPTQAAIIAFALAFVPYLILRGPIERVARLWFSYRSPGATDKQRDAEREHA